MFPYRKTYRLTPYYLLITKVLFRTDDIGFHSLLAGFPASWTYLAMLIGILECLNQTQNFVYGSTINTITLYKRDCTQLYKSIRIS